MEDKLSIVFCTRKDKDECKEFIDHINETCGFEPKILCVCNPDGISLSKIYADMMVSDELESDIVLFIHDDIEFLKKDWGKEVIRLFDDNKEYGIIGVAGSAQFDENAAWWNYKKIFGQVLHRSEGKSWLTAFSPLLEKDLQEVVVVDGLFIGVNRKRISENFSRELDGFDFYDIDFCLSNFFGGKCKIGVTTNIRLAHNSTGELKQSWYENKKIINKKYKNKYPIDILKNEKDKRKK